MVHHDNRHDDRLGRAEIQVEIASRSCVTKKAPFPKRCTFCHTANLQASVEGLKMGLNGYKTLDFDPQNGHFGPISEKSKK